MEQDRRRCPLNRPAATGVHDATIAIENSADSCFPTRHQRLVCGWLVTRQRNAEELIPVDERRPSVGALVRQRSVGRHRGGRKEFDARQSSGATVVSRAVENRLANPLDIISDAAMEG